MHDGEAPFFGCLPVVDLFFFNVLSWMSAGFHDGEAPKKRCLPVVHLSLPNAVAVCMLPQTLVFFCMLPDAVAFELMLLPDAVAIELLPSSCVAVSRCPEWRCPELQSLALRSRPWRTAVR